MKTTQELWASLFEAKEVDNEGDMAADQLFTIADAAEEIHDMLEDDTQLPSWVQSKIAKVAADLDSVRDYMIANFVDDDDMEDDEDEEDMEESYQGKGNHKPGWMLKADPKLGAKVKANIDLAKKRQASYGNKDAGKSVKEEVEQIDELSKKTLGSYAKKANQSAMSAAHAVGSKGGAASDEHINKMFKRKAGVNKAVDRLTKEEVDITEKLSVSQGMGAWIDDFKQSDAPQFKGKSDKERRDMAIAAFMSAKRAQKEDVQESTDKDYIEQKLADADINASVQGKVVMVDKEDLLKAKAIVKKLGYTHQVKAGLNA